MDVRINPIFLIFIKMLMMCATFSINHLIQLYGHSSHVIGSGISAAHLTLKLINESHDKVIHLWMNKDIDIQHFDADPGWLGPKI